MRQLLPTLCASSATVLVFNVWVAGGVAGMLFAIRFVGAEISSALGSMFDETEATFD